MKDFVAAAKPALKKGVKQDEKKAITFDHEGTQVTFYQPTTAQMGILMMLVGGRMTPERIGSVMNFYFGMMDDDTKKYFEHRMFDHADPQADIYADNGMLDIIRELAKEWTGKDSEKSSASKPPQRSAGRSSTASTRAKASTSSS